MSELAPFSFSWIINESTDARFIRCFEELLDAFPGGISELAAEHPERLRSFVDISTSPDGVIGIIAGKTVADFAQVKTNCAVTQHAALCWCGEVMKPYVSGEPITSYIQLEIGGPGWVPNDGINKPTGAAIAYVAGSARLKYDHVKALGAVHADGVTYDCYQGGGGDGTRVTKSTARIDEPDSYGRRTTGWWLVAALLPPFVAIGGPADDTTEIHDAVTATGT